MRKNKNSQFINLKSLFSGRKAIELAYIDKQNVFSTTVVAALILAINVFWLISWMIGVSLPSFNHLLGQAGILFSTVSVLVILILLLKRTDLGGKTLNAILVFLHFSINITVVLLALGRCLSITRDGNVSSYNGITLSTYYVVICAFLPFYRKRESIICMAFMLISGLLPPFVLKDSGPYILAGNIIIRISSIAAYFAFRMITIRSAELLSELVDTSYRDVHSGFLNARALLEYISTYGQQEQKAEFLGVMVYDIDDFKRFNDEYSHVRGDLVLKQVSETVNEMLSADDAKIFRYNGDEFVAIVENISEEELLKKAIRLKDLIEKLHIERHDGALRDCITITVGCTFASGNEFIERDILSEAETQLFIGKKGVKNCVIFKGRIFVAEGEVSMEQQPTHYTERVALAICEAMRNKEIKAYYQPLYETVSHKLVGAEALSRWEKNTGEIITPSAYIPELEKNSSILALDWYMYEEVCKMLNRQREMNIPQVRISVNFSRMHMLYERNIDRKLVEIADSYGIPHNLIEIEITESAYIHLPNIVDPLIKAIRAEGFLVAVDDFGSGASSLEFIKNVDVDTLKIDRSLISSNYLDEKERVLLESVVFIAHRLQLNSVAEGVETMEQMGFLKTLGVNQIQGFIFSKPQAEAEFLDTCRKEADNIADVGLLRYSAQSSTVQMLMDTIFKEYPVVVISNLSRNSYYTMSYESMEDFSFASAGSLTELFEDISKTMSEADAADFRERFAIEAQIANHENGMERFYYTGIITAKDGRKHTMETTSYFIKETDSEDLLVITLCAEKK